MLSPPAIVLADYASAAFAILGVVIGGAISGGAQFYFARRKEKAENRSAARLVDAELGRARAVIQRSLRPMSRLDPELAAGLKLPAWKDGRGILAVELPGPAWEAVRDGAASVDEFRQELQDPPEQRDATKLKDLGTTATHEIDRAKDALAPHTQIARPPGWPVRVRQRLSRRE